jgi:hypothetical protein
MTEHLSLTAEQGAIQAHTVERTNQSPAPDNATFEALFRNPQRNPFRGWNPDPRTIHGYQFVDVVLDGISGVCSTRRVTSEAPATWSAMTTWQHSAWTLPDWCRRPRMAQ